MLTRRDFLKLSLLSTGAMGFRPYFDDTEDLDPGELIRICVKSVSVHSQPNDDSRILYQRYRDELVHVYQELVSEHGPSYNPVWYRVWGGYIHSGSTVKVKIRLNRVINNFPENGQLMEITVPFAQGMRYITYEKQWQPLYRLYQGSTHWIYGSGEGPDGDIWYRVRDELLKVEYMVPSAYLRPVGLEELSPISPDFPAEKKWIFVSLNKQTVTAYEGDKVVFQTRVSTGVPPRNLAKGEISTNTPRGKFNIQTKVPSKHMGDGNVTADINAYELPGVPWVCYFEPVTGVAFHGTYWHTNYGTRMSHGCVNMRPEEARWLYRWSTPTIQADEYKKNGFGTQVIVDN